MYCQKLCECFLFYFIYLFFVFWREGERGSASVFCAVAFLYLFARAARGRNMIPRERRVSCLGRDMRLKFCWLLLLIIVFYVLTFEFVLFLPPVAPRARLVPWRSFDSLAMAPRKKRDTAMYHHFPVPLSFTTSLDSSIETLDRQWCAAVRMVLRRANAVYCSHGAFPQCVVGRACSTLTDKKTDVNASEVALRREYDNAKGGVANPWIIVKHKGISPINLVHQGNALLSALGLAHLVIRIERDIHACRLPSPDAILAACKTSNATNPNELAERAVLVEFSTGNANLLFTFCPPDPLRRLRCYGVEKDPILSSDAKSYQKHISIENGDVSPLRDGSATHVLLNGILHVLPIEESCALIREGLRLLMPKGILLVVMLSVGTSRSRPTGYHPFFFNDTAVKPNALNTSYASSTLRCCSTITKDDYNQLVEKVEFLWHAPEFIFYTPDFKRTGVYAVRLTRSKKMMPPLPGKERRTATPEEEEPALYKDICTNPRELSRVKDAQALWRERLIEMQSAGFGKKLRRGYDVWVRKRV
ncbi:hypothetical protein Tc00.1047053506147.40 [Trypanosoma cruzi]|uniref:Uncharacterized protein n=1 Tax=Trypanosoma cruzi (strain CL Brener) TaxID=353153 RepID=Q4DTA3_TRYCC|nr:hypothetical protein Tc00.1047053506147.40 [Trypanosoma cruzi]EAN95739.1 hypothetical protein Tc00.1047053506147.40 [Trypanosoma cruzi]|eukprot:XP_817590.1 hypothetical protein [Trypanosoma cruzi strain CL Brener]